MSPLHARRTTPWLVLGPGTWRTRERQTPGASLYVSDLYPAPPLLVLRRDHREGRTRARNTHTAAHGFLSFFSFYLVLAKLWLC